MFAVVLLAANFFLSCRSVADSGRGGQSLFVLQLRDGKTGLTYASFTLPDSVLFSISFKHSVNQSDIEEGYSFRNGNLFLDWCLYSSFGAGVATELEKGQTLSYTPDGKMFIDGFNRRIERLSYEISTVYDHFLHIDARTFNLTELGLKGKRVEFTVIETW